jgi:hypothetical protein
LGIADIHQITKVYGDPSTFNINGSDITSQFVFDSGQKDTHYDLGYLYPKAGYSSQNAKLIVQLDYFTPNNASGSGFYTVESYPIDNTNLANNNAIQTKNIPLYIDESGNKTNLRDYVDFRPYANNTANNTGALSYDANNAPLYTSIVNALNFAAVNPSNTLSIIIPPNGLNTPSYGQNLQADYTIYLPRKDIIYITPDNVVKVKEGLSSLSPQTPLYPENSMVVATLNIPPYPSLTTDETDSMLSVNKLSKNLVRDTSSSISCSMVTNRRYTMQDIGTLDQRITNLEYYTALSLLETNASNLTVTDQYGMDRFKNGIFVEAFSDFSTSDVSNHEFSIAIDSAKGIARPHIIREVVKINFNSGSSTANRTGRAITIPYTEVPFIVQPYATKYRSAAHVAYAWNGTCFLFPSYDNHNDIVNTGSLNIVVDNTTAWSDFASSPFGSVWGDWRTTSTSQSNTVTNQVTVDANLGKVAGGTTAAVVTADIWTYLQNAGYSPNNYTVGNLSLIWGNPPVNAGGEIAFW